MGHDARDETSEVFFRISNQAHEYVKSKTTYLTLLRGETPVAYSKRVDREDHTHGIARHPASAVYGKRLFPMPGGVGGSGRPFARDYARVIHSPSFRRLQGKTQLIPAGENEFFRTRLTHSLEVAEIARRIAWKFNSGVGYFQRNPIDPDLVSSACLLHDIGHAPFGHSGEDILNRKMLGYGGFEGNAQTLRIVTNLENRLEHGRNLTDVVSTPEGLNLTIGTLASVLKYDHESKGPARIEDDGTVPLVKGYYPTEKEKVTGLREKLGIPDGVPLYTIECQIMDLADDIAYSAYDLEDALESGIIAPFDLMSIDDKALDLIKKDVQHGMNKRGRSEDIPPTLILNHLSTVFDSLLVIAPGQVRYDFDNPMDRLVFVGRTYAESIQHARNPLIRRQYLETLIEENIDSLFLDFNDSLPFLSKLRMDDDRLLRMEAMKAFNFHKVISSRRLQLQHHRNKRIIETLFDALAGDTNGALLSNFQRQQLELADGDERRRMRLICDIISSLTDLEALNMYDQLTSSRDARFWNYARP